MLLLKLELLIHSIKPKIRYLKLFFLIVTELLTDERVKQKKVILKSFKFSYYPLNWMFSFIRSHRKITKLQERFLLLSKEGLVNIDIRKVQQLMIDIFHCVKCLSLPIMNEIFMLKNTPYNIRNLRDVDKHLSKTLYCGLETITCKGPQL